LAALKTYVLDASALVSYLQGSEGHARVVDLLKQAHNSAAKVIMSVVNWGEAFYVLGTGCSEEELTAIRAAISRLPIQMFDVDLTQAETAARLKLRYKLPYADAMAAALAQEIGAVVITKDGDFQRVQGLLKIVWLVPPKKR
jgi:predicted nucleic acid-binding protein